MADNKLDITLDMLRLCLDSLKDIPDEDKTYSERRRDKQANIEAGEIIYARYKYGTKLPEQTPQAED